MQFPARFESLPEYAFPRLRRLLGDTPPGGDPIAMSIGEPQHPVPDFVGPIMLEHSASLSRYPPNEGLPELRGAISDWLARRYGVAEAYRDPEHSILPLNGTREGLFAACIALSPEAKNGQRPAVLMPNPFYQCYAVAAITAGAEPVYVPATAATGHLPDFAALPEDLLARTTVVYICAPANPQGACADAGYWRRLFALAERHDFRIFADECYSEIWRERPPVGALEVLSADRGDPERLVVFHSLSKRSNLAGLRSGFACTGPENRARMLQLRAYAGAPLPIPAQHAAAATWADEAHVGANRALYQEKFAIADEILGNLPGYAAPEAGFFLWLELGDGEAAALRLWREAGVRALPGAYLSRPVSERLGGGDPGAAYLRLALVAPAADVRRGLEAVARVLT
ncbi:aminotransferase class I/II-fold pyridoxal phosphate-dependent enzyme [Paralimibaculum aggregatum]|uniref:Aminotransferase class I/II-fold pyridoxal phosphate-dependent enzyme n=1 Tax=Paralimibaculum aggregatum TaxID=3036245 RepID=A0ABQ6LBV9_9RHOB|nr:aminotransferase class I/II-fold pyridoxal phosphate-dependent enzyme [Limibaculum sp. NKW23]GMG80881.1 aminotransferase class I/II-fold pyridoxal phosphate-dependent enzyme [Limibaculum sp. NKW23]